MAALSPPTLTLQDLDREELLQLFKERLMFRLRPSDLWGARWEVLARRALQARERELEAFTAYVAACGPIPPDVSDRTFSAALKEREAKRQARERLDRAANRAEAARDRAWDALQASFGSTAA